jgi:hypothetical protein
MRPYGRNDIFRFNSAYRILYPVLNRLEKACAETLVDGLLGNLESESLASKIYGVV